MLAAGIDVGYNFVLAARNGYLAFARQRQNNIGAARLNIAYLVGSNADNILFGVVGDKVVAVVFL